MNTIPPLAFHYAIKFPDGTFYNGPRYDAKKAKYFHDNPEHRTRIPHSYTYTESRAHNIIRDNPKAFENCIVVRVL